MDQLAEYSQHQQRAQNLGLRVPYRPNTSNSKNKTTQQDQPMPSNAPWVSLGLVNRALLIISFLMIAAACMYGYSLTFGDDISRAGHSNDRTPIAITIDVDELQIPINGIRFENQRSHGPKQKLELYRHWPSLSGYTDEMKADFNGVKNNDSIIFLTLEKRDMRYDMSGRVGPIYSRFFIGPAERKTFGLVRQPMDPEAGFIDEDLYFAAASPYPFATRCVRAADEITTPFCIRDIHVGKNMMLTYRFHKNLLPQWIELDQALRAHVKSMITNL